MAKSFDPEQYALSGSEEAAQIALFGWAQTATIREAYPELRWLFAIPNGGFRTKAGAGKLRAMGVKAGVPDMCLPIRRGEFGALFIELKKPPTPGKRLSQARPEQNTWIEHLKKQGYGAAVCYGFDAARQ